MKLFETVWRRLATTLAMSFEPMLSSVTPLQLFLQVLGCFIFHKGMTVAVSHSAGQ